MQGVKHHRGTKLWVGTRWKLLGRMLANQHSLQFGEIWAKVGRLNQRQSLLKQGWRARCVLVLESAVKASSKWLSRQQRFRKATPHTLEYWLHKRKKHMNDSVTAALLDSSNSLLCSLRFMFVIILSLRYGQLRYQEKIRLQKTAISLFGLIVKTLPIKENLIIFPDWNTYFSSWPKSDQLFFSLSNKASVERFWHRRRMFA